MEKIIRTFSASISEETLSVNIDGENTDVIVQQVITDTESGEVVCNQKIRKSMPTSEAWDVIREASGQQDMPERPPNFKPPRLKRKQPKFSDKKHYMTKSWKATRHEVLLRDGWCCQVCKKIVQGRDAQIDHIISRQDGGGDMQSNLQVLCASCHAKKFWHEHNARK